MKPKIPFFPNTVLVASQSCWQHFWSNWHCLQRLLVWLGFGTLELIICYTSSGALPLALLALVEFFYFIFFKCCCRRGNDLWNQVNEWLFQRKICFWNSRKNLASAFRARLHKWMRRDKVWAGFVLAQSVTLQPMKTHHLCSVGHLKMAPLK